MTRKKMTDKKDELTSAESSILKGDVKSKPSEPVQKSDS